MEEVINTESLKQVVDKIEKIETEKQEISDVLKDAYSEAKSLGYDIKIIKHVLKLKKKKEDELATEDSLIELYRGALGV